MHKKPASKQRSTGSFYTWIARYSGTFMFLLAVSGSFVYAAISWPTQPGESGYPVEGLFWNLISKGFVNTTLSSDGTVFRSTALKQPGGTTGATVDSAGIVTFTQVARGVSPVATNDLGTKVYIDTQIELGLKKLCEDLGNTWNDTTKTCVGGGGPSNSCNSTQPSCQSLGRCSLTTGTPTSVNQSWVQNASNCGFSCSSGWTGADCNTAVVSNSCSTSIPSCNSLGRCSLTTGTPTSVNQSWVQNASNCGYSCTGGWSGVGCTTPPATVSGTLTATATSCVIPVGQSVCTIGTNSNISNLPSGQKVYWTEYRDTTFNGGTEFSTNGAQSVVFARLVADKTNFITLRYQSYAGTVISNTLTLTATCASGSTWNGSSCAPAVSATITAGSTSCTIPAGQSSCSTGVTFSTNVSNLQSGSTVYFAQFKNGQSASNLTIASAITTNGSSNFFLSDRSYGTHYVKVIDNIVIASANTISNVITVTASCASGSTWNGSICANTKTAIITSSPGKCDISIGKSSCNGFAINVVFQGFVLGVDNITIAKGRPTVFSTSSKINSISQLILLNGFPIGFGSNTIYLADSAGANSAGISYDSFTINGVCEPGSTWNGTICASNYVAQASFDCAGDRNGDNEEDLGWFDSNNVFSGVKQYCSGTRGLRCGSKGSALHYVAETRTIESTTPQCCTIDRVSINGWCVKYSDVGQYCYTNNQCKVGIACVNNVCAYKTENQWCSPDESCAPGLSCISGICRK